MITDAPTGTTEGAKPVTVGAAFNVKGGMAGDVELADSDWRRLRHWREPLW